MKLFRKLLRYWIALASVITFLGGWIILAHSPKPVSTQSSSVQAAGPLNLPPIQAYGSTLNNSGPSFFSNNNSSGSQSNLMPSAGVPMLRTRGS